MKNRLWATRILALLAIFASIGIAHAHPALAFLNLYGFSATIPFLLTGGVLGIFPNPSVDCQALSDEFTRESGRISPEIQKQIVGKNMVLDLIERGPFPDGMGYIINVMTVERSFANQTDDTAWTPVSPSTGTGNAACLPNVAQMTFGQTLRQFQLARQAVETLDICLEDLRTDFMIDQQLGTSFDMLSKGVQWLLELQAMNQYMAQSGYHISANSLFPTYVATPSTTFDLNNMPTSGLTQGMLDYIYTVMSRITNGDGSLGRTGKNGAFIQALICSPETDRALIMENADIRQDVRYAYEGDKLDSPLLAPYGIDRSYGNYAHYVYQMMPRYDLVNNVLTRRSYWVSSNTTKGIQWQVNPLYLAAAYEVSFIFNPMVYKWLVPGSINSPGGTTRFTTPDYFPVSVSWKNILSRECNPDGTIGFFRAVMAMAPMPRHPEYGWVVLHRVCPPQTFQTNCNAS